MKFNPTIPEDIYAQASWHKARLDLSAFMVQSRSRLPRGLVEVGRDIWRDGATEYPSHSVMRGWYVELIYGFIDDCKQEIEKLESMRLAA